MIPATRGWSAALLATAGAWLLYVWTGSGRLGWSDAAELAAAGQQLGIAHAPGEPAYLLLVRLAQLVPVGDLAARALWLAAACAAGVVGLSVLLADRWLPRDVPRAPTLGYVAVATAACGAVWIQGVVVELYALCVLLVLVALLLSLRSGEHPGAALGAGLATGLAGAVNPLMVALSAPGLLLAAFAGRRPPRPAAAGLALLGLVLGGSVLLYLPLRSAAQPGVWMAVLDEPDVLWGFVTGRDYTRSFGPGEGASLLTLGLEHLRLLARWVGVPALVLGAAGLVVGVAQDRKVALPLVALGFGALGATMTRTSLETYTPDIAGYLVPTCLLGLVGGALALGAVARRSRPAALALAAVCGLGVVLQGGGTIRQHADAPIDAIAAALLEVTPPGGMLIAGSDSTSLPVMYAVTAGRRRPDVALVSGYAMSEEVLRRLGEDHPHLSIGGNALDPGLLPEVRHQALIQGAREAGVVGTVLLWPPELTGALVPAGLGLAVGSPGEGGVAVAAQAADERVYGAVVEPLWTEEGLARSRQLRRLLTATAGQRATALLDAGRDDAALAVLQDASRRHPDPTSMIHLQRATAESGGLGRVDLSEGTPAALGRAALRTGDPIRALPLLERAATAADAPPGVWEDLGCARFLAGDLTGSSEAWSQALSLRPGSPWALAGKERLYSMGIP